MTDSRTCMRTLRFSPNEARPCHRPHGHDGAHECVYKQERVRWPSVLL